MGTIPITAVLYSNTLAHIRSIERDSWLPGAKFAFIVGHLAKNEAVQKCYVTRKTYTAVLVGPMRTKIFYNMLQNRYYMQPTVTKNMTKRSRAARGVHGASIQAPRSTSIYDKYMLYTRMSPVIQRK